MDLQDDVLQLFEFLSGFFLSNDSGSYIAAEFVVNCHDSKICGLFEVWDLS